jgi:hypothetical protein
MQSAFFAGVPTGQLLKPLSTGNSRDGGLYPPYGKMCIARPEIGLDYGGWP